MNIVLQTRLKSSLIVIFLLFCGTQAFSEPTGKSFDPSKLPINEQTPLNVYWKERSNQIIVDSVCFNYPEDTSEQRGCRKLAGKKFHDECRRFEQLYRDSRPYYDEEYKREMAKYCQAAEEFVP